MTRARRVGAWGFEGERYDPSPALLEWLAGRLGPSEPFPRADPARAALPASRTPGARWYREGPSLASVLPADKGTKLVFYCASPG